MADALRGEIASKNQSSNCRGRAILPTEGPTIQRKHAFGPVANRDMLIWLKRLASNPCYMTQYSTQIVRNQMLSIRKFLRHREANYPKRMRKFKQNMNDGKSAAAFGLNRDMSDKQNAEKRRKVQSSSISSPPNVVHLGDSFQGKQENTASTSSDTVECVVSRLDFSHLSDSVESIKGSNSVKQGSLKSHCKNFGNNSDSNHGTKTSTEEETNKEFLEVLKSLFTEGLDSSRETSHPLSSKEKHMELKDVLRLLLSNGDHLPRPVIPIGPRFQAEVPKWEGPTNKRRHYGGDDLRWLGTKIWPTQGRSIETNAKAVGRGRADSCSCKTPRSVDCVKLHINEARVLLLSDIGPAAFSNWKFDEMGEQISKSWTLKDQRKFESLIKLNSLSNGTNFWKLALGQFPSKSMKSLVSYYYNVYIPRRLSLETRSSSFDAVESDNDQTED